MVRSAWRWQWDGEGTVKVIRSRGPVRVKFKPMMALHGFGEKNLGLNSWGEKPNRTPAEIKEYVWAYEWGRVGVRWVVEVAHGWLGQRWARRAAACCRAGWCGRMYRWWALLRHLPSILTVVEERPEWAPEVAAPIRKLCVLNACSG